MEFRDALKLFRSQIGLAQADIASALHINIATVGRWEQGKNVPNRSCGIALLDYAKNKSATRECVENLEKALSNNAKQKLFNKKNSLYTVEHATISQLVEDGIFPIYVCDLDTDEILYANRATEQQLGKSLNELAGKKCYECIMGSDKPCEFCHKSELVDDSFKGYDAYWPFDGGIYHVKGKIIRWNGRSAQIRYVFSQGSSSELRHIDANNAAEASASDSKPSDNTSAERNSLQNIDIDNEKSIEQIKAIFKNINGGVSVVIYEDDGTMRLAYANDNYYNLFGYTKEQFVKELKTYHDTTYPDDRDSVAKRFAKAKETKQAATFRYRVVKRDKSIAYFRCNLSFTTIDEVSGYVLISILTDITESVQAEQQAIVSGQRLDAIMNNINNAVTASIIRSDGTIEILFTNDSHYEMLGYTKEQYQAEVPDPLQLVHPDDMQVVRDAILGLHRIGDVKEMQYRIFTREGKIKTLRMRISMMTFPDADGPVQLAVHTDITDIVEAQQQLVAQHERISELFNDTPSGIAIIEVDPRDIAGTLRTTFYNDRFINFSGYARDEYDALHNDNEMAFVFREDIPKLLETAKKVCDGEVGISYDSTVRCHTKDGSYCWLLLTGQLVEKHEDTCVINIVLIDITERMEAIDRQRINEEMLRIAAETDQRFMIVYDVKKNSCRVESRMLFSAKYGEVIEDVPKSLVDRTIIAHDSIDEVYTLFTQIRKGEQRIHVSLQMHSGPDKYEWFECHATTVFDAEGLPDHAVLVFHNITEQRIKEAVFKKWQQSIAVRPVESYTLFRCNLSKDSGIDQQEGELLKISFSAITMSFNNRTKLYADEFVFPDDRETYVKLLDPDTLLAMFYRGEHFTSLDYRETAANGEAVWRRLTVETVEYPNSTDVQAFLMYEDIDEEKKTEIEALELAESDPLTGALNRGAFVEKVDEIISKNSNSHGALIMLDMDGFKELNDTFGHAAGDQALQDVVAVLRSFVGSDDLVCRLGGDEFMVWLRDIPYDAVIGKIAQQICDHIRKAYSQEVLLSASVGIAVFPRDGHSYDELYHNADKALYRVKQATKGSYAFFSVTGEEQTEGITQALSEVKQIPRTSRSMKRRMLIVDDNEINRLTLKGIFKDDYLIETAKNGAEAMIRLRHFGASISVVLLDLLMPGVDGFSVLRRMQSDVNLRTIPVIVVTGDEEHTTLLKAFELGAAEYVAKPVDVDIIRMRVQAVISKAENERLRAQNSYLMLQRDEEVKYRTVLESTGTVVIEYDWRNHIFIYDSEISKYIAGNFNHRGLWQVFLSDRVGNSNDVKVLQDALINLGSNRGFNQDSKLVKLKTPEGVKHWFRVNYYKNVDDFGLAEKLIITFNDVHDEILANDKLLFQATRDELTGLYNRTAFLEKAAGLIADKEPGYYVMACINVEKFQVINDRYGTDRGDEVLKHIAATIGGFIQNNNGLCCRYAADKFAVLYPAKLLNTEELEKSHKTASMPDCLSHPLRLRVGRCLASDISLPVSAMFDRAAMAEAFARERYDTYIIDYDDSMRDNVLKEQKIVGDMVDALKNGEFEPWFQPQYNHSTGALIGAEALVRWRKDGRIIPPYDFIPIFEKNGFIYEVDQSVWRQVCVLLRRWVDEGKDPLPVSVNISRNDMFQENFIDVITGLVEEYRLPAELLRLEITESAFSDDTATITDIAHKLIAAGFTVEIDDFGSGYSSLNTLKDVPASILKLDMRFFEQTGDAKRGGNIVESIVRMAKWLGMAVIAEGVEDKAQADYLKSIGCFYIQGYLYAKPMPSDEYEKHLDSSSKEAQLTRLQTMQNLDNNDFWDSRSMDTLIFNSYVGAACILEISKGKVEMLRATDHFVRMLGSNALDIKDVLVIDWMAHMDNHNISLFTDAVQKSLETKETVSKEFEFHDLPRCPETVILRSNLRVIATVGERSLIYCLNENITAQRLAEEKERLAVHKKEQASAQMQAILDNVDVGVVASVHKNGAVELLFANEKYYSILGYSKEQYESEVIDHYDTFAPEDRQRAKGVFIDDYTHDVQGSMEAYMLRRDGTRRLIRDAYSTCHIVGIDVPVHLSIFRDVTDEREAELREKRFAEEINLVMANVNCGIGTIGISSMSGAGVPHFIFTNDQFYTTAGYTKEQIKAEIKDFTDFVHPDDVEKVEGVLAEMMTSQTDITFDFRCIKRDGSIVFLNSSVSFAEITGYGKVAILVQTDITEVIQSKQNIQQLANQLEVILYNTADAITAIALENGTTRLVFANDKYYEHLGVTKEIYASDYDVNIDYIIEEDREKVASILLRVNTVGIETSIEFRIKRSDGAVRWMHSNITVVDYPGVKSPVQLAVTSDITEMVEAAQKEQRLSAEMLAMMTDMPGGFVRMRVDSDQHYVGTFCNEGFCKLLGMDSDLIFSRYSYNPMADVHPDDVDIVRKAILEMQQKGKAHSSRYRLRNVNDDYVWVTVFGRFTKDQSGNTFLNLYYTDETINEKATRHREMLMDNLPWGTGAYGFKNGQMSLIYQNKSYWDLVGLHEDKFPDPAPMSAIHPDDVPRIMQKLAVAIEHHEDVICDIRLRHLTLGYRQVRLVARAVPDESDGFLIVASFIPNEQVEITYQQTLPLLLTTIMGASNDYAFAKDRDLRYICCSPAFIKLVGLKSELDAIGKTDFELFSADIAEQFRKNDLALLESDKPMADFNEIVHLHDGTPQYCLVSKYILHDIAGANIGIYGVSHDIRKEL